MRWIASLVLLVLSLFANTAHAASFDLTSSDWEGSSRLVSITRDAIGANRVHVVEELDYSELAPNDGLLMLHPQGNFDLDELTAFMKMGGRVAVADDFGDGDRLLERFHVVRSPGPSDPKRMLHGNPHLALAEPTGDHPLVQGVDAVVLNHPTVVRHAGLTSFLRIPLAGGDAGPDVALLGTVGDKSGRLVAIGDPSMFINAMLRFRGNQAFTRNLVRFLVDGNATGMKRESRLYIVTGHFKERGSIVSPGLSGGLRDRLRRALAALDFIRGHGFSGNAVRVIALAIAIAAAAWVILRAGLRLRIPETHYAVIDPSAEMVGVGRDDPRLAALFVPQRRWRFWGRDAPSAAGVQALLDAVDSAVEARSELVELPREEAVSQLALESGLLPHEVRRITRVYDRLERARSGRRGVGPSAWMVSREDVDLLGRVLAPIARKIRSPWDL